MAARIVSIWTLPALSDPIWVHTHHAKQVRNNAESLTVSCLIAFLPLINGVSHARDMSEVPIQLATQADLSRTSTAA